MLIRKAICLGTLAALMGTTVGCGASNNGTTQAPIPVGAASATYSVADVGEAAVTEESNQPAAQSEETRAGEATASPQVWHGGGGRRGGYGGHRGGYGGHRGGYGGRGGYWSGGRWVVYGGTGYGYDEYPYEYPYYGGYGGGYVYGGHRGGYVYGGHRGGYGGHRGGYGGRGGHGGGRGGRR